MIQAYLQQPPDLRAALRISRLKSIASRLPVKDVRYQLAALLEVLCQELFSAPTVSFSERSDENSTPPVVNTSKMTGTNLDVAPIRLFAPARLWAISSCCQLRRWSADPPVARRRQLFFPAQNDQS